MAFGTHLHHLPTAVKGRKHFPCTGPSTDRADVEAFLALKGSLHIVGILYGNRFTADLTHHSVRTIALEPGFSGSDLPTAGHANGRRANEEHPIQLRILHKDRNIDQ